MLGPSESAGSGNLLFHLRSSPQSIDDIASDRLPVSEVTQQAYYEFTVPPQSNSKRKDYFLSVELEGKGEVQIFTADAGSYEDGALYKNQTPQESQLVFQLEYDRSTFLAGLAKQFAKWIGILAIGFFAFILPGWALFSLLWPSWNELSWKLKLGLSSGLSLAIYPLFLLWTDLIGLHLYFWYAWLPPLCGILILVWKNRKIFLEIRNSFQQKHRLLEQIKKIYQLEIILTDIAFLVILGLVIISRFWIAQLVDVPLYGDSYQHTMVTQLIIDQGGLFNNWKPYADLITFTYHFGFHSAAAVFYWISGVNTPRAVLWTGQIINNLAILGLYPLAYKVTKNQWAGIVSMLVAGLLLPIPMTYVNWGRYTQLIGQAILPSAIWIIWFMLERPLSSLTNASWVRKATSWRHLSIDIGSLIVVWLVLAGLGLSHYRVLIFVILFIPACSLLLVSRKSILSLFIKTFWIGIGGAIFFLPWFIRVFGGKILSIVGIQITTLPSSITKATEQYNQMGDLTTFIPISIWILLFICIAWGIWKKKKELLVFIIWWLFIILATNPNWIGLPGAGVITNFAIHIAFYIHIAVIIGLITEWLVVNNRSQDSTPIPIPAKFPPYLFPILLFIVILGLGIWGLPRRINDLNIQKYALVTRPDLRAMAWIRENTPLDARFLINSFSAFWDSSVVGSDGGWWMPLLANRNSTVPPLLYVAEQGISPDYGQQVKTMNDVIKANGITAQEALELLNERGVSYVYIGQRRGQINYSETDILDPQVLIKDQNFQPIYHEDRVWVFKILY